jgi:hypothetical protein
MFVAEMRTTDYHNYQPTFSFVGKASQKPCESRTIGWAIGRQPQQKAHVVPVCWD